MKWKCNVCELRYSKCGSVNIRTVIRYSHCGQNATELLLLYYNSKDFMLLTFKWSEVRRMVLNQIENWKCETKKKLIEKGKPQKGIPTIFKFKKILFVFVFERKFNFVFISDFVCYARAHTHFFAKVSGVLSM